MIRVVLGEDDYLVREGLRQLLDTRPDIEVVAACPDLASLLAAIEQRQPDVVVTDIRMPPGHTDEGIRVGQRLRATHPGVGVVILSQYGDASFALALLAEGSSRRAYLLKERVHDVGELVGAIRSVAAGGSVIDPVVVEGLVEVRSGRRASPLEALTPRELAVLSEMAVGKSNAGIAASLVIAEGSVEKYVGAIFSKLGITFERDVHRRVRAVLLYLAARQP